MEATVENAFSLPIGSVKELLEHYRSSLMVMNRSPKTIAWYIEILSRYFAFLESKNIIKPINELGKEELKAYIQHLQKSARWENNVRIKTDKGKLSPYSVQCHVRAVKAFWSWLANEGYIEKNVLAGFPLPKVPQYVIKTLTFDHIKKLFSAIDRSTATGARYHCMLMLLLDTGLRISEVVKIKMNDVDFKLGLIIVVGKGQKERVVPFTKWTRKEMIRYINKFRSHPDCKGSPYLFPASNGGYVSISSVQQFIKRLAKEAGLNNVKCSPHIFRHTFATQAIANGANVFAVKEIMGHASLQTTLKYTHLQIKDLKTQHNKFSPVEGLMKPGS
jgi:site-specific recombinase XerD